MSQQIGSYEDRFQACSCGYDIKVILNSQVLTFILFRPDLLRHYIAKIPYIYSGQSKEIQDIYQNLDQFFVYIKLYHEDLDRFSINSHGTIKVVYMIKKSKNKTFPTVLIQTEILQPGTQTKMEKKIKIDLGEIRRQNVLLKNQIRGFKEFLEEEKKTMQRTQRYVEQWKNGIRMGEQEDSQSSSSQSESQTGIKRKHKKHKKIKNKSKKQRNKNALAQLQSNIAEITKQVNEIQKNVGKQPQVLQNPIKQYPIQSSLFGEKMIITVDKNNKNLEREFKVEGNLIQKIRGYGRYQVLGKQIIPPRGRHYFVMYIQHITYKIFSFGIVNQSRRNYNNSFETTQIITYFAKTGAIWQYGDCRGGGPQIPNGVEMRVVVDRDKHTVKWYMNLKQIAGTVIGEHLRYERLVPYLEINYSGDKVYWNQKPQ